MTVTTLTILRTMNSKTDPFRRAKHLTEMSQVMITLNNMTKVVIGIKNSSQDPIECNTIRQFVKGSNQNKMLDPVTIVAQDRILLVFRNSPVTTLPKVKIVVKMVALTTTISMIIMANIVR